MQNDEKSKEGRIKTYFKKKEFSHFRRRAYFLVNPRKTRDMPAGNTKTGSRKGSETDTVKDTQIQPKNKIYVIPDHAYFGSSFADGHLEKDLLVANKKK